MTAVATMAPTLGYPYYGGWGGWGGWWGWYPYWYGGYGVTGGRRLRSRMGLREVYPDPTMQGGALDFDVSPERAGDRGLRRPDRRRGRLRRLPERPLARQKGTYRRDLPPRLHDPRAPVHDLSRSGDRCRRPAREGRIRSSERPGAEESRGRDERLRRDREAQEEARRASGESKMESTLQRRPESRHGGANRRASGSRSSLRTLRSISTGGSSGPAVTSRGSVPGCSSTRGATSSRSSAPASLHRAARSRSSRAASSR